METKRIIKLGSKKGSTTPQVYHTTPNTAKNSDRKTSIDGMANPFHRKKSTPENGPEGSATGPSQMHLISMRNIISE